LNKKHHSLKKTLLSKKFSWQPTRDKPVRPVWETGQIGFAWTVGKNSARGKNSTFSLIDLPIHSTDSSETLGIVGVPCGLPLARSSVPKTYPIKRNQKSTFKNTFPRTPPKTIKSGPFAHGFGRGIKGKRTTKGSCIHPPSNPKEKSLETTTRKSPRKGSENH
jgi:hypothetical protein